ncbi:MAG: lipoprotein [Plesiomonas shigelloides]
MKKITVAVLIAVTLTGCTTTTYRSPSPVYQPVAKTPMIYRSTNATSTNQSSYAATTEPRLTAEEEKRLIADLSASAYCAYDGLISGIRSGEAQEYFLGQYQYRYGVKLSYREQDQLVAEANKIAIEQHRKYGKTKSVRKSAEKLCDSLDRMLSAANERVRNALR